MARFPSAISGIRQLIRGQTTVSTTTTRVAIPAVTMSKARVVFLGTTVPTTSSIGYIYLSSPVELTITTVPSSGTVSWQIEEEY